MALSTRLAWFLGAVLLVKLTVVLQLRDHPLVQPEVGLDTTAYVELARRVLAGDLGLGPGLYYVSPLYIYFLAAGLAVTDSFTAVRLLQVVLGTAAVGFIFAMARVWFGTRAAWMAAALAAVTGLITFYETLLLQASIDFFLTSAGLLALTLALQSAEGRASGLARRSLGEGGFLLCGAVFGLQTLNRPNILLAAAGLVVVLAATRRFRAAMMLAVGLVVGMAPVSIRNVVVARQWSFVSSHGGLNFYMGNGEGATGFYHQIPGITPNLEGQVGDARRVAERALGRTPTDGEASDYFYRMAWSWTRGHPGDALVLFARKLGWVFHAHHIALPYSYPFFVHETNTLLRWLPVGPWLLAPLGLVGLIVARPVSRPSDYWIWLSFVPLYAAAVAVFFVAERYRLPLLVPLCVGAGAALDFAAKALSAKRVATLAVPALVFVALLALANRSHTLHDGRWEEGLLMAQRLVILGRYDEANQWAMKLESNEPRPGMARHGVGLQLIVRKETARAIEHLARAHQLDPANPKYAYDLAVALKESGDAGGSASLIRRINPPVDDDVEAWLRLGRLASEVKAPDVAERFFRQAAAMRPDQASARQQFGLNLLVLGRLEEAAGELTAAARLDPRDADTLSRLAYCELKLGRLSDARAHVEAALAINPGDALAIQLKTALR